MRSRISTRLLSTWTLVLGFVAAPLVTAQPLADKVPDDAIIYIGMRGTDDLGPGFAGSHLKEFLDASQVRELLEQFLPQVLNRIGQEDRQAAMITQVAGAIIPILVKHPTAIYVGPVDDLGTPQPKPHFAFMCDAGKDSATLSNIVGKLLAQLPPNLPVPIRFETQGSLVTVTVGVVKLDPAKTLVGNAAFQGAMAQVSDDGGKSAATAGYFNFEAYLALIDQVVQREPQASNIWQGVREVSGIGGVKRIAWASGFDGKDWGMRAFVDAPKPRTGLLTLSDYEPLGDDLLKAVPESATSLLAVRFDWTRLMAVARTAATKFGAGPQLDQGIQQINGMLGLDVEKDLLEPLGDQWAIYGSPQIGGEGLLGVVMLGRPRDAAKLEKSLSTLEQLVNRMTANEDGRRNPKITFMQARDGDLTLHYLAVPFVTPAWTIRDGTFIAGLSPQSVSAAAAGIAAKGKSILDNQAFAALRKRVGGEKATALSFIDLPKTAPEGYAFVLLLSRATGIADLFGVTSPAMVLPTLPKLLPLLSPAGGASYADDTGFHARAVTPFPGAELFGGSAGMIGPAVALLPTVAGFMVPAAAKARAQAKAVSSMSNLRQIGIGAMIYANDHNGMLPPDLGSTAEYIGSPQVYLSANAGPPPQAPPAAKEQLREWVNANSSYVYVGGGQKLTAIARSGETVLAHEKFQFAQNGSVGVVFVDGHAEILPVEEVQRRLAVGNK